MKKALALLFIVFFIFLAIAPSPALAQNNQILLSDLSEDACLEFIRAQGVEIPDELENYSQLALFVKNTICAVENNPNYSCGVNYGEMYALANAIKQVVNEYYGRETSYNLAPTTTYAINPSYSLQSSTKVGAWKDSYMNYNCYAYVLGHTYANLDGSYNAPHPGSYTENSVFDPDDPVEEWAELTKSDLSNLGYACVYTSTSYTDIMNYADTHTIICMRKDVTDGIVDYHYMTLVGNSWYHKPANTHLLSFNYLPVVSTWSNERSFAGIDLEPNCYYGGTTYYFAFRVNHTYKTYYADQHHHTGTHHFYYLRHTCSDCGDTYYGWIAYECDGPPCQLEYTSIPNDPILTTK